MILFIEKLLVVCQAFTNCLFTNKRGELLRGKDLK